MFKAIFKFLLKEVLLGIPISLLAVCAYWFFGHVLFGLQFYSFTIMWKYFYLGVIVLDCFVFVINYFIIATTLIKMKKKLGLSDGEIMQVAKYKLFDKKHQEMNLEELRGEIARAELNELISNLASEIAKNMFGHR